MTRASCADHLICEQESGRLMLVIELADPAYHAVEFTLKDQETNAW